MWNYIKKDFLFTRKWVGISVAYCVLVSIIAIRDNTNLGFFVYFLIPFFVVQLPLNKVLSMEDNKDTREFLKRMPQKGNVRVLARVCFIAILLFFSMLTIFLIQVAMNHPDKISEWVGTSIIISLIFMVYFLLELNLFYYKSFHLAQNSVVFVAMAAMVVSFALKNLDIHINILSVSRGVVITILLIANIILYFSACMYEKK